MDKLEKYQNIIIQLLTEYADYYGGENNSVRVEAITDITHNHYQLLRLGWDENDYIFQCLFHLDIVDSKIWIQRNTTEVFIAEELVRLGVEKSDIVLGLKHPSLRPFTEYATT